MPLYSFFLGSVSKALGLFTRVRLRLTSWFETLGGIWVMSSITIFSWAIPRRNLPNLRRLYHSNSSWLFSPTLPICKQEREKRKKKNIKGIGYSYLWMEIVGFSFLWNTSCVRNSYRGRVRLKASVLSTFGRTTTQVQILPVVIPHTQRCIVLSESYRFSSVGHVWLNI